MKKLFFSVLGAAAILAAAPSANANEVMPDNPPDMEQVYGGMVGIVRAGRPILKLVMGLSCKPEYPSRLIATYRSKLFVLTAVDPETVSCYYGEGVNGPGYIMDGCGFGLLRNRGFELGYACWHIEDIVNPRGAGYDYVEFTAWSEEGDTVIDQAGTVIRGNATYVDESVMDRKYGERGEYMRGRF